MIKLAINNNSGIYFIINILNDKFYIGSTINLRKRRNSHFSDLNNNKHSNKHLQNAFNLEKENFKFVVIEYCNNDLLEQREQYYLDLYWDEGNLYNIFRTAYLVCGEDHPLFGKSRSLEVKNKIRAKRKNQIIVHSQETKDKISNSNFNKIMPVDSINKMVDSKLKGFKEGKYIVWNKGLKTGIDPINKIYFTESESTYILEMYNEGKSIEFIRKKVKVSWDTIKTLLNSLDVEIRNIKQQKIITDKLKQNERIAGIN